MMIRSACRYTVLMTLMTMALGLLAPTATAQAPSTRTRGDTTLYQRLGGYDAIAAFVDLAFPRVAAHPNLRRLFQGHSQDSQLRQRQLIVDMLCRATHGPCVYIGRPMRPVHTGLGITSDDWETFLGIIRNALDERNVPASAKADLLEIFERRFRPDVVEKNSAGMRR